MKRLNKFSSLSLIVALALAALPTVTAFADALGPVTSAVAVAPNPVTVGSSATVTATVDDTTTDGSTIASADYSLDGGATWTAMTASDGAFDSVTEAVTATFTASTVGTGNVCVHGTDSVGNVGADVCASFTVQSIYTFRGFLPPVRATNNAQAGRNVPLKWFLTLTATGAPVSDKTSFVAVMTYSVDCTTLVGDSSTAVVEKGPGKSGLKYQGNGRWMFNWKTSKSYAGTCRMMFVEFSDGSTSPEVLYIFR